MNNSFVRAEPAQRRMIRQAARNGAEFRHQFLDFAPFERPSQFPDCVADDSIAFPQGEGDAAALVGGAGHQTRDGKRVFRPAVYRIRAGTSLQRESPVLYLHASDGQGLQFFLFFLACAPGDQSRCADSAKQPVQCCTNCAAIEGLPSRIR